MTRYAKINHVSAQELSHFSNLLGRKLRCGYGNEMKLYITHAEIHGESFKAHRMKICYLEQKILLNI